MNSQVRYNGEIYDILGNVMLGNHQFLIIGAGSEHKFFDIAFIEKRVEPDKVRYILPNVNYEWNSAGMDYALIQGQGLMDHIVNGVKDAINQDKLIDKVSTQKYIADVLEVLDTNADIKGFFEDRGMAYTEVQLEESIKTLIGYYEAGISKKNIETNTESIAISNVPEEIVDRAYADFQADLENTQNFGSTFFYDRASKEAEDTKEYVVDPTNHIFEEKDNFQRRNEEVVTVNETVEDPVEETKTEEVLETTTETPVQKTVGNSGESITLTGELSTSDIEYILETKGSELPFQERLYLENLRKIRSVPSADAQTNVVNKTKTLSNGKSLMGENAAYVSISFFLYLIGSFELLLSIILLAKYL